MSPPFKVSTAEPGQAPALRRRFNVQLNKTPDVARGGPVDDDGKNPLQRFDRTSSAVIRSDQEIVVVIDGKRCDVTHWAKVGFATEAFEW
jgi:hypothetical protein